MREDIQALRMWGMATEMCEDLQQEIRDYYHLIEDARDLTGLAMDGMPHSSTPGNPTESKALRTMALEEKYGDHIAAVEKKVDEIINNRNMIEDILSGMSPIYKTMCTLKYKRNNEMGRTLSWMEISWELNFSEPYVKKMHYYLLRKIRQRIGAREYLRISKDETKGNEDSGTI